MEKLKKENTNPTESELIESLFLTRSARSSSYPRSVRSLSFDGSDDSMDHPFDRRRRTRLRPVAAPPGLESDDEEDEAIALNLGSLNLSRPSLGGHAAQRPKLETIQSAGSFPDTSRVSAKRSKRRRSTRMKPLSGAVSPVGDDTD
ncbi:hypothetical protein G7046_g10117 [Stylonectria norvegica]|nr:hypothetical protein G7046_g10117 [Stylonectria norvegica]